MEQDKKQTLVHYLANLVNSKYPELKGFDSELKYIDKAAQFSLENILTDVRELEKGAEKNAVQCTRCMCARATFLGEQEGVWHTQPGKYRYGRVCKTALHTLRVNNLAGTSH